LIDTGKPERKRKKEREEQSFSHKKFEFGLVLAKGEFSFPPPQSRRRELDGYLLVALLRSALEANSATLSNAAKSQVDGSGIGKARLTPKAN
jgi:hypothetical protein